MFLHTLTERGTEPQIKEEGMIQHRKWRQIWELKSVWKKEKHTSA